MKYKLLAASLMLLLATGCSTPRCVERKCHPQTITYWDYEAQVWRTATTYNCQCVRARYF